MWYGIIINEKNGHKEIHRFERPQAFHTDMEAIFGKDECLFSTEEARENYISMNSEKLFEAAMA